MLARLPKLIVLEGSTIMTLRQQQADDDYTLEPQREPLPRHDRDTRFEPTLDILTTREAAVLALVMQGSTNRETARVLGISPRTVEFHRANIMQKFGARNVAELMRIVLRRQ
jgi:DNA-binding CsgD family transcriptional regulator